MPNFYEPEEDTWMVIDSLKEYFSTLKLDSINSLEFGVGNGEISRFLCEQKQVQFHEGIDINPFAIKETERICKDYETKSKFYLSNLFENVTSKFDLIVFNPPYLPKYKKDPNDWITKAIVGGRKGPELIFSFLKKLSDYLTKDGVCFLLFSKLTDPNLILILMAKLSLEYELVLKKSFMMEELYVYKIKQSSVYNSLISKGYTDITYLAKGSHGIIYTAKKKDKIYSVKTKLNDSKSIKAIISEAKNLKHVNTFGVGPKFIDYDLDLNYMIYEYINGIPWVKFYETISLNEIKKILILIAEQCYKMDKAGFEKKEMHRPNKNVLIENNKPILIDFERGLITENPSNVTQFLQYLTNSDLSFYLRDKKIFFERDEIIKLGLEYRKNNDNFKLVLEMIKSKFSIK